MGLRILGSSSGSSSRTTVAVSGLDRLPGVIIADRGQTGGNGGVAGAAQINTNSRHVFTALYDCADLRPVFANHQSDTEPNAAVAFKATIEYPLAGGIYYKLYFRGRRLGVAEPGSLLIPDPVAVDMVKGTQFAVRTYTQYTGWVQTLTPSATLTAGTYVLTVNGVALTVNYNATAAQIATAVAAVVGQNNVVGSGGPMNTTAVTLTFTVPFTTLAVNSGGLTGGTITLAVADKCILTIPTVPASGDAFESSSSATSKADGEGSIVGTNNAPGPSFILGRAFKGGAEVTRVPVGIGIGDSLISGSGSVPKPSSTATTTWSLHPGWFNQAMSLLGMPWLNLGLPGEQGASFVGTAGQHRRSLLHLGTAAICDYPGVNDIHADVALATLQANTLTIGWMAYRRALTIWQTTVTPYQSASADSWTTVGSQTAPYGLASRETTRQNFNAWVRDGLPIDATSLAAVAVGTNTNVLRAGATGHPFTGFFEVTDLVESSRNSGAWAPAPWTGTINTVNGVSTTVASTVTGTLRVGDSLVATGIPAATLISAIAGSTLTLVNGFGTVVTPTATASGVSAAAGQTVDGIHPTPSAAGVIAASVVALIGAQITA